MIKKDKQKKEKKTKKKAKKDDDHLLDLHDLEKLINKPAKSKKEPKGNKGPAKERAQLIYKLKTYKNNKRLGPKLKDADFNMSESYYNKLSVGDLNLELEKYDMELSRNGLCDMINHGFKAGLKISENVITQKTKLNVVGTCDKLFDDDNFLDLFERVKLKYNLGFVGQMDPLLEMSLVIFQTGLMVHGTNKFRSEIETKINLDEEYNENENIEEEE
jgi:hypothetical protein